MQAFDQRFQMGGRAPFRTAGQHTGSAPGTVGHLAQGITAPTFVSGGPSDASGGIDVYIGPSGIVGVDGVTKAAEASLSKMGIKSGAELAAGIEDERERRRVWNQANARKSRLRKKLVVEACTTRAQEVVGNNKLLRQLIESNGLQEKWSVWAADKAPALVHGPSLPVVVQEHLEEAAQPTPAATPASKSAAVSLGPLPAIRATSASASGVVGLSVAAGGRAGAQSQPSSAPLAPASHMLIGNGAAGASLTASTMQSGPPRGVGGIRLVEEDFHLIDLINTAQRHFLISDPMAPDNPVVFSSPGFFTLTGYSPTEILGRNCRFLQGPGTTKASVDKLRQGIYRGVPVSTVLLNYRKDGQTFWNQVTVVPLRGLDGTVSHYVGVQQPVTAEQARRIQAGEADAASGDDAIEILASGPEPRRRRLQA